MSEPDDTEIWRAVVGYEGVYSVSNIGRVRTDKAASGTYPGKMLGQPVGRHGYHFVRLHHEHVLWAVLTHRLVAHAFFGTCPKDYQVNHKNGVKSDNRVENLEYVTRSENTKHACRVLGFAPCPPHPRGEKHPRAKLKDADIRRVFDLAKQGRPQREIARTVGIRQSGVWMILSGRSWKHIPRR